MTPAISNAQYWADEDGGVYNIPSVEFNPTFTGFGSDGDLIYNKIDLQNGQTMQIVRNTTLYDNLGNSIATAWDSAIGWNHEIEFRDGGIIAGAIRNVRVDGIDHKMVFAWSVNSSARRQSGWMKLADLSPSSSIQNILEDNYDARLEIIEAAGAEQDTYKEANIVSTTLPSYMQEYYLDPGRPASYTAGKARYYYTGDDNYISGLMNIPETSRQRYGVAHDIIPLNAKFYYSSTVPEVDVSIYAPSSHTSEDHKLTMVWGYSLTSSGEKVYSWINSRALSDTGATVPRSNPVVTMRKSNATDYALDGRNGASNGQNVHLWTYSSTGVNQEWIETDRGGGYYSYVKNNTNHSLDGGNGGAKRQNVTIWSTNSSNYNQHWRKVAIGNGVYRLEKRNALNFAIDGGSGGSRGQNIALWSSVNHGNLHWYITEK